MIDLLHNINRASGMVTMFAGMNGILVVKSTAWLRCKQLPLLLHSVSSHAFNSLFVRGCCT